MLVWSRGGRPVRTLLTVRLPLLLPAFTAALALSMGELGATIMIYPSGWRTLPVTIFALSDRGSALQAPADTVVLLTATLVISLLVGRMRGRAATA